jgi:competence protein ComEC
VTNQFVSDAMDNAEAEVLLDGLTKGGRTPRMLNAPAHLTLDQNVDMDVIWPPPDPHYFDNESSMVLQLRYGECSILFTGDIQSAAERSLALDARLIHCDVLVAPHHGSSESTTASFIAAANPTYVISSNDSSLTQKQVAFEEMVRDRKLLRTDRRGAVAVELRQGRSPEIRPFLGK